MSTHRLASLTSETGAELLQAMRAPEFIIPTILLPSLFYLMFGIMLSRGNASIYLLATYGVFAVSGPSLFGFGVGVATEREKGWLDLKRVMPVPATHYIVAKILTTLVFAALSLLPIYIIAGFVGDVALPRAAWWLLLATHLLAVIPFSLIGLILGYSFGSGGAIAVCNIVFLGFAVLGGLWFPISLFPAFMQSLAQAVPSFHLGELALSVVDSGSTRNALLHLSVVLAISAVLLVVAIQRWRRQT